MTKLERFLAYFDLKSELEDFDTVHETIEKGIVFKGTNLWILMFAIVVASVGLNMNSTAVIIGAMLISPLMGPINGLGYGLATYDFDLFRRSLKHYVFAVGVSLLTSALYFLVTPVNTAHSELLSRTSPTFYDVVIALFGGLAGIVAISSKLKGNVIPGVAIATALMPPICTAGYGLATLQFHYFFGALYLFTINTVFIAVAALFVCQYLKFPFRSIIDPNRKKRVNQLITIILLVTIVPSVYFAYLMIKNEEFTQNSNKFIGNVSFVEDSYLLDRKINTSTRSIDLVYSGYGISEEAIGDIKEKALRFYLDSAKVNIKRATDASILERSTQKFQSETEALNNQLNATNYSLHKIEAKLDSIENIPMIGKNILKEIKALYPQVHTCAYSETFIFNDSAKHHKTPVVIFTIKQNSLNKNDKIKIETWLAKRLEKKLVKTYFEEIAQK